MIEKLKKIKVFLTDVDGVLTDGRIFYAGQELGFNRYFHVADGYGLKVLKKLKIKTGVISGGQSIGLQKRVDDLGLNYVFLGNEDKRNAYREILKDYSDEEILYIGDEFFDLPLLKRAGFSATVDEAPKELKENVDYICKTPGGSGAVREVIDLLMKAQKLDYPVEDF